MIVNVMKQAILLFQSKKGDMSQIQKILILIILLVVLVSVVYYFSKQTNENISQIPDLIEGLS